MESDRNFAPSFSSFLALHTNESAEYLNYLVELFMQGAAPRAYLEPSVKQEIAHRIADIGTQSNVPSFLHYDLQRRLIQDVCSPGRIRCVIDTKYTDFFGINCTSAINSIFVKNA